MSASSSAGVSRLYSHVLHVAFSFLPMRDLFAVLRTSRDWCHSVLQMPCAELTVNNRSGEGSPPLSQLIEGLQGCRLTRRHVTRFCRVPGEFALSMRLDELLQVCEALPRLVELHCNVDLLPAAHKWTAANCPLKLPTALTALRFDFGSTRLPVELAIQSFSRLPLLTNLYLQLPGSIQTLASLPVEGCVALRSLTLTSGDLNVKLLPAHVASIRALPNLTELSIQRLSLASWMALLARPHSLKLEALAFPRNVIADECLDALVGLPTLTNVSGTLRCTRYDWIAAMPNLTSLYLLVETRLAAPAMVALLEQIATCTRLRALTLSGSKQTVSSASLARCFSQLHSLTSLTLNSIVLLEDDASLFAAPCWSGSLRGLTNLSLSRMAALPQSDPAQAMESICGLRSLVSLKLHLCSFMKAEPSDDALGRFRVPSSVLPQLQSFEYRAPQ